MASTKTCPQRICCRIPDHALHECLSGAVTGTKEGAKKMARPEKEKALRKEHRVTVRYKDVQYGIVEKNAQMLGVPIAEYVRHISVHGKVEVNFPVIADLPELQKLTNEFAAIGNNLNQIAKYFNTGGLQSKAMREEINSCIAQIMQMRKAVMEMAGDFNGDSQTPVE